MGIGPPAIELYRILRDNHHLDGLKSVVELGSQDIPLSDWHQNWARDYIESITGEAALAPITAEMFHKSLGFTDYCCIDADGNNGALVFDLNLDLRETYGFDKQFDLVTNHGTSEHVFNQYSCFKNVHNLLRVGGLALHAVPFEGYLNHCFFNYQPSLFIDISIANRYELIGMWYHSQRKSKRFKYRGDNWVPLHYTDDLLVVLDELCRQGKMLSSPLNNFSLLSVVYRKTSDDLFRIPFDARFSENNKIGNNYIESSVARRNTMYTTADHLREVNSHLGRITLMDLIRGALREPKTLSNRFRKMLFSRF